MELIFETQPRRSRRGDIKNSSPRDILCSVLTLDTNDSFEQIDSLYEIFGYLKMDTLLCPELSGHNGRVAAK